MKTVLVTGITGFIGTHTAIQLLEKGYQVIGTSRTREKGEHIQTIIQSHTPHVDKLRIVQADLSDSPAHWAAHMQGVEYVLHIASPFPRVQPKDDTEIIASAKQGVLHVLQAARRAAVNRVVLTSSSGAIVYGNRKQGIFTEADWTDETNRKDTTPYFRSKTVAEKAAWEFVKQHLDAPELSVVNPGLVLGPILDTDDYGTSGGYILKLIDGSLPAAPDIGYAMVDVRSVAALHVLAMEHPQAAGERFIASNSYMKMLEVAEVLREVFPDRKIPKAKLPSFVLRILATWDKETAPVLIELGASRKLDNSKATNVLAWKPIEIKQSILDTAESLIQHGFVK